MNASLSRAAQGRPTKPAYAAMIVCLAAAFGLAASIAPAHADPENRQTTKEVRPSRSTRTRNSPSPKNSKKERAL